MKKVLPAIIVLLLLPSCISKSIKYIQDKNEIFEQVYEYDNRPADYKIQKQDILYVKITSTNKDINEYFNLSSRTNTNNIQNANFYLDGFTVSDSGYINVPVLGKLLVEGLTVKEANDLLQQKTDEHLNNAIATLKLVSFYIDFLGEVRKQGRVTVMQDNINILDAIAMAGGINDFGDKRNVLVVRKTKDGTKTFRVDLTERDLLTSDKFYLLPYDMVIVEPVANKTFRMNITDYTLILTTLTSTITMVLLILNLTK